MICAVPGFGEGALVLAVDAQHIAPANLPELHFLLAITHHITTSENFVNPTTNIVRLVEVNQIHRRG